MDFSAGLINTFPFLVGILFQPAVAAVGYSLTLYPRKSTPSSSGLSFVFPSLSVSPRGFRNSVRFSFTFSSFSFEFESTKMSSANRTGKLPFSRIITSSTPFIVMLNIVGDIGPPCGTPCLLLVRLPLSSTLAFNHCFKTFRFIGMFASNHSWLTESYAFAMSTLNRNLLPAPLVSVHT